MKTIVIIASTFLLLLCNWAQAIVPINQSDVYSVKTVDFTHFTKGKISNESQIINLIEDLDIDSEEDNSEVNNFKSSKDNKSLFQNFGFLSTQNLNCLFNYKTVGSNSYIYFSSLCGNSNPIYILNRVLRI
jgi:hypothetical protein